MTVEVIKKIALTHLEMEVTSDASNVLNDVFNCLSGDQHLNTDWGKFSLTQVDTAIKLLRSLANGHCEIE